jgi:pSer/pThr/pTyr-binding forkhead associated (FHA) protein
VEDLGSTNGTFVNDRPLTRPVVLRPGDTVSIGRSTLEARA